MPDNPQYGSGNRPDFPDWGFGNILDPTGALRTLASGGDIFARDPYWQYNKPGPNAASVPQQPNWQSTPQDPYGLNLSTVGTPERRAEAGIGGGRDAAIQALQDLPARFNAIHSQFTDSNVKLLDQARGDWNKIINQYQDLSAQAAQRHIEGMDANFNNNVSAYKAQAEANGVPQDQINGQINQQRMQLNYQKGTMLSEMQAKVNETRLAAQQNLFGAYGSMATQAAGASLSAGLQGSLSAAQIQQHWGDMFASAVTTAETVEQQFELAQAGLLA